jgi:hypothetical protein
MFILKYFLVINIIHNKNIRQLNRSIKNKQIVIYIIQKINNQYKKL